MEVTVGIVGLGTVGLGTLHILTESARSIHEKLMPLPDETLSRPPWSELPEERWAAARWVLGGAETFVTAAAGAGAPAAALTAAACWACAPLFAADA